MSKTINLGKVKGDNGKDATVSVNGGTPKNLLNITQGTGITITVDDAGNVTIAVDSSAVETDPSKQTLSTAITVNGKSYTTVEGAISAINNYLASKTTDPSKQTLATAITVNGKSQTTVEGAIDAINTYLVSVASAKQNKTLETAVTVEGTKATTVEEALAALNTNKMKKVTGREDQYVGFDSNGNPVARNEQANANAGTLFGFELLNSSESDPGSKIRYIGTNAAYKAAHMDFEANKFDIGDWGDAWFIKNIDVVAMKQDGTIANHLNKNNYAQDVNGNAVDITSNSSINVMVGIPTVWIKVDTTGTNPKFWFSPTQVDDTYHAWAHTDANGKTIAMTYIGAYDGYNKSNVIRSVSGVSPTRNINATDSMAYARANNTAGGVSNVWDMNTFADRMLIVFLLMLIGKTTDTQQAFGRGNENGYHSHPAESDGNGVLHTGTLNTAGLFWGASDSYHAVKVFGIENFWGNIWKWYVGLINNNGTYKVKLTHGTQDGSTATDYNLTGDGYISAGAVPSGEWQKTQFVNALGFILPATTGGASSSTYYCDHFWSNNAQVDVALFGGYSNDGSGCGAFYLDMAALASGANWDIGVSLSSKPLAA